jgi:hypothetical protein
MVGTMEKGEDGEGRREKVKRQLIYEASRDFNYLWRSGKTVPLMLKGRIFPT